MSNHPLSDSAKVDAILWKLGLKPDADAALAEATIEKIRKMPGGDQLLEAVCKAVARETLYRALLSRFHSLPPTAEERCVRDAFNQWVRSGTVKSQKMETVVKQTIEQSSPKPKPIVSPIIEPKAQVAAKPAPPSPPPKPQLVKPPPAPPIPTAAPAAVGVPADNVVAQRQPDAQPIALLDDDPMQPNNPSSQQWRYLPLPEHEPDPHSESDCGHESAPGGFQIVGARVRGKKHKHDGTHSDDWFEYGIAGEWTILAVSDGGGSYQFSRVGARAACQAATVYLQKALQSHAIEERERWDAGSFECDDIKFVKEKLVKAMEEAWQAVQSAVAERSSKPEYEQILGRPLTTKDLYCTLLLTVHKTVRFGDGFRSLIFALAIGDGMVGAVDRNGRPMLLMTPDSGEHSGEVRFLDQREVDPERLYAKIFPALCNLRCLMAMTDGVADDYFPNDPGMSLLYGDLVLNGVLPIPSRHANDEPLSDETRELLRRSEFGHEFESPTSDGMEKSYVCSIRSVAIALNEPAEELIKRSEILETIVGQSPLDNATAAENLRRWLDTYQVRGSFDDRTLLALFR